MDESKFDGIVAGFYRAATGLDDWATALDGVAREFGAWAVPLWSVDKNTGALLFSHHGGEASPAASLDYIRHFHRSDPRTGVMLGTPTGTWVHCHEHLDEQFVASSDFYQNFLIPHGGRYSSGVKLLEDDGSVVCLGVHRGHGRMPFDVDERAILERIGGHAREAVALYRHLRVAFEEAAAGRELLDKFAYPMLLVDELGGIRFRNTAAKGVLAEGDYIVERGGVLTCRDRPSHADFMTALQDMGLQGDAHAAAGHRGRRYLRISRVSTGAPIIANLVAIRPHSTMRAFGNAQVALVLFHDPSVARELDPFLVAEMFDLTPAEARVAVALRRGDSAQVIADSHRLSLATVRSQIQSIFAKTGVNRQADLVRLLEGLAGFETLAE